MTNLFFVEFYAGIIPESLGNLANLRELYLYQNQLSGQFFYFSEWSVPTDQPIFRSISRREHPCIFGQPGEFEGVAPL